MNINQVKQDVIDLEIRLHTYLDSGQELAMKDVLSYIQDIKSELNITVEVN